MSDKKFFRTLDAVLNDIVEDVSDLVGPDDVTIGRLVAAARKKGKDLRPNAARLLIGKQVEAGVLVYVGKRKDPVSLKSVSVWRVKAK